MFFFLLIKLPQSIYDRPDSSKNKVTFSSYQINENVLSEELDEKKSSVTTFEELLLAKRTDLVLDGIESLNGSDAYMIKNGKTTLYYDVASGLKVFESKLVEKEDKKMTVTTTYTDYRVVKGVKVPYEIIINQGFELDFKMSEVKINEGVLDTDFQ